jgi:hypothetical protein
MTTEDTEEWLEDIIWQWHEEYGADAKEPEFAEHLKNGYEPDWLETALDETLVNYDPAVHLYPYNCFNAYLAVELVMLGVWGPEGTVH